MQSLMHFHGKELRLASRVSVYDLSFAGALPSVVVCFLFPLCCAVLLFLSFFFFLFLFFAFFFFFFVFFLVFCCCGGLFGSLPLVIVPRTPPILGVPLPLLPVVVGALGVVAVLVVRVVVGVVAVLVVGVVVGLTIFSSIVSLPVPPIIVGIGALIGKGIDSSEGSASSTSSPTATRATVLALALAHAHAHAHAALAIAL
mmetsp:Transcript_38979/g.58834  ORF Transcript_38979/g.58834 Transcript_38979/m.58834 type:complete len:200 (+) Transcript_38979:149-748(+)